jgi:hypothetical protein
MRRLFVLVFLTGLLASTQAAGINLAATVPEDLRAHRFEVIEQQFEAVEADFQAGRVSEFDLLDAWKAFYPGPGREDMGRGLGAWMRERPNSWIAKVAFGTFWRKRGEASRGQGPAPGVPAQDFRDMTQQLDLAKPELWRALETNPRSWVAMLNLMNIAQFESDDALADKVLALSEKAYPRNLVIRARYLIHVSPRWGGSMDDMDRFISKVHGQFGLADVAGWLDAARCDQQGSAEESEGRLDRALTTYQRCMVLARGADPRYISSYVLYAARHCDGAPDGRVACR